MPFAIMPYRSATIAAVASVSMLLSGEARAQGHQHTPGMVHEQPASAVVPTEAGQAAFAAVAEIVRLLEADPTTEWSAVNLEALRLHLRDMDRVMMESRVRQSAVDGGVTMDVTGEGELVASIQRMLGGHASALESELPVRATATVRPDGMTLTVLAKDGTDAALIARLRGLGFAGLLARGDHHMRHHLMIARGASGGGAHKH